MADKKEKILSDQPIKALLWSIMAIKMVTALSMRVNIRVLSESEHLQILMVVNNKGQ